MVAVMEEKQESVLKGGGTEAVSGEGEGTPEVKAGDRSSAGRGRKAGSVEDLADKWLEMWGASERGEIIPEYDADCLPGTDRPIDDPKSNVFKIAQAKAAVDSFRFGLLGGLCMVELARHTWVARDTPSSFKSKYREVETVFQSFSMNGQRRYQFIVAARDRIRKRLASMIMDKYMMIQAISRKGVPSEALSPAGENQPYAVATESDHRGSEKKSGNFQVQTGESVSV
jgi:hypothetical protein